MDKVLWIEPNVREKSIYAAFLRGFLCAVNWVETADMETAVVSIYESRNKRDSLSICVQKSDSRMKQDLIPVEPEGLRYLDILMGCDFQFSRYLEPDIPTKRLSNSSIFFRASTTAQEFGEQISLFCADAINEENWLEYQAGRQSGLHADALYCDEMPLSDFITINAQEINLNGYTEERSNTIGFAEG